MNTKKPNFIRRAFLLWFVAAVCEGLAAPLPAQAQFGGGHIVFDPSMFSRQLQQLRQETATVTNLAQQLRYIYIRLRALDSGK